MALLINDYARGIRNGEAGSLRFVFDGISIGFGDNAIVVCAAGEITVVDEIVNFKLIADGKINALIFFWDPMSPTARSSVAVHFLVVASYVSAGQDVFTSIEPGQLQVG